MAWVYFESPGTTPMGHVEKCKDSGVGLSRVGFDAIEVAKLSDG